MEDESFDLDLGFDLGFDFVFNLGLAQSHHHQI